MKSVLNFRPLFFAFVALALGIRFSKDILEGNVFIISFFSLLLVVIIVLSIYKKHFISLIIVCVCFSLGLGIFVIDYNKFSPNEYSGKVTVVGRVSDEVYGTGGTLLTNVTINGENTGNLYVYITSTEEDLSIGDYITFSSKVESMSLSDYGDINTYYYANNQYYFAYASLTKSDVTHENPSLSESFKLAVKKGLEENMSEDGAKLAFSVLFGDRSDLSQEVTNSFSASGLTHLLAVSGLNISFLATILYWLLSKLKLKHWLRFIITAVILLVYCYLCGFGASVTRATLMSLIFLSAGMFGKRYDILNSLSLAGLIILMFSPLMVFDLGFLLSFFCVFSIALFASPFTRAFQKIKLPKAIAVLLALTLCTQIGIMPFMANYFGQITIFTFLANLICIPVFNIAYGFIFCCLIILPIEYVNIILFIPDVLFKFIILVADLIASLNIGVLQLFKLDYITIIIFYLAFFMLSSFLMLNFRAKISICVTLLCVCFCYSAIINQPATVNFLSFSLIDGESESVSAVITTPNNKVLYIGSLTEEGQKYLKYKRLNVDYYISDTKSLFDDTIIADVVVEDISIKFFKSDYQTLAVLVKVNDISLFYAFDERPETYQILNVAYELMSEEIVVLCDTFDVGYAENITSAYYASEDLLNLENSYSIEEYGSFTMSFNGNILNEIRSVN